MTFWGVEVQPEKPYLHSDEDGVSKLHLSHATLGLDCKGKQRTVVKCKVGDNPELLLCSLIPGVSESCALDLLFDQEVTFTVSGATSVHLTGYYMPLEEPYSSEEEEDEYDSEDGFEFSDEEDIAEDDSDLEQVRTSSDGGKSASKKRKSEEPVKAKTNGAGKSAAKDTDVAMGEESEDEDGFPVAGKKRGHVIIQTPKKKQAVSGGDSTPVPAPASTPTADAPTSAATPTSAAAPTSAATPTSAAAPTSADGKKKKKKKNKTKSPGKEEGVAKTPEPKDNGKAAEKTPAKTPTTEAGKTSKNTPIKKYPNGLEVEELAMGKPDGKQAVAGKKVAMQYTGKLKTNGKIFDSTVGKKPFEFRLGVGEVIKGWDVGVNGMRIGDKRRLTIPPQMAYGTQGVKGAIPANAWLTFDVELVNVK